MTEAMSKALARRRESGETDVLARELSNAYHSMAIFYREKMGLDAVTADAQARECTAHDLERVATAPADQVTWHAIERVMEHDAELGLAAWERVKREARAELDSGHRAAAVLNFESSPWDRAQFLAIRAAFRDEWRPRGGVEDVLLDSMALSYGAQLFWVAQLAMHSTTEATLERHHLKQDGAWQPARVEVAAYIEQSAAMAERFNRLFLRTLRALQNLRRFTPVVVVQNAQKVNVGSVQANTALAAVPSEFMSTSAEQLTPASGAATER